MAPNEDFDSKPNKRNEPRQLLRIKRKKLPNGLVKLELRYVSYQPDAPKNDGEVASAALANLFAHFMDLRGDSKEITQSDMDPVTQALLLRMENETLKRQIAQMDGNEVRSKGGKQSTFGGGSGQLEEKKHHRRIKH
ncbi:hypothetical protein M3Y98_00604400 [Aphelenchoides besseyi]|nr:hypothetical protein M3Y98_00604400 [Aphelenchoides besseyi]KAI6208222.1 hypothetical protein M3Y96_00092400 [Aphelenchoides besseyi]